MIFSTARAAAVVLIAFAAAMWTSVGFDEMCSYGVLVVAGGAALLGTCDTTLHLEKPLRRKPVAGLRSGMMSE